VPDELSGRGAITSQVTKYSASEPNLVHRPIVASSSTSRGQQQINQHAAENERNAEKELQNGIHHGFLQGDHRKRKT
jgi:hypothetical protein